MDPQKGRENRKNCPPSTLASHDTSLMTKSWKHFIANIWKGNEGILWINWIVIGAQFISLVFIFIARQKVFQKMDKYWTPS